MLIAVFIIGLQGAGSGNGTRIRTTSTFYAHSTLGTRMGIAPDNFLSGNPGPTDL